MEKHFCVLSNWGKKNENGVGFNWTMLPEDELFFRAQVSLFPG